MSYEVTVFLQKNIKNSKISFELQKTIFVIFNLSWSGCSRVVILNFLNQGFREKEIINRTTVKGFK